MKTLYFLKFGSYTVPPKVCPERISIYYFLFGKEDCPIKKISCSQCPFVTYERHVLYNYIGGKKSILINTQLVSHAKYNKDGMEMFHVQYWR